MDPSIQKKFGLIEQHWTMFLLKFQIPGGRLPIFTIEAMEFAMFEF